MTPPNLSRLFDLRDRNEAAGIDMMEQAPRFAALKSRYEDGTAPQAVSAFNLFQTPEPLAARLASLLGLQPGARVLEPSAGLARIVRAVMPYRPAEVVAVEIAPELSRALFQMDLAGVTLKQGDFLAMTPGQIGTFDAVAMNPPFHMRADIRHTLHALTFLRPGGRLAGICMAGPRRESELRPLCSTWEPLPPETFRAEGTNTAAVLFTIIKK